MKSQKRFSREGGQNAKANLLAIPRKTSSKFEKWTKRCSLALMFILLISVFSVSMFSGGIMSDVVSFVNNGENNSLDDSLNVALADGATGSTLQTNPFDVKGTFASSFTFVPDGAKYGESHQDTVIDLKDAGPGTLFNDPGNHSGTDHSTFWFDIDIGTFAYDLINRGFASLSCTAKISKSGNTDTCYGNILGKNSTFTQHPSGDYVAAYNEASSGGTVASNGDTEYTVTRSISNRYVRFTVGGKDKHTFTGNFGWTKITGMSMTLTLNAFGGGVGSSGNPFIINNLTRLQNLQTIVNTCGWNMSGRYLRQSASIYSVGSLSIGTSGTNFAGTYNGYNNSIYGLNLNGTTYQGFFGYTNGATIENLTVNGTVTGSSSYIGGIVANASGGTTIRYCTNNATISGSSYTGGILGRTSGGTTTISNCTNNGTVTGTGTAVGGILGYAFYAANISSSTNTKNITGTIGVGGIVGDTNDNVTITSCTNDTYATISGSGLGTGGIVGRTQGTSYTCTVNGTTTNKGTVVNTGSSSVNGVGGIVGYANGKLSIYATTTNSGAVYMSSGTGVGGIVGYVSGTVNCTVSSNYIKNTGAIGRATDSSQSVGGIVGYGNAYTSINNVTNQGAVKSSGNYVGGIIGNASASGTTYDISNCQNSGTVGGANYVGGIAGISTQNSISSSCKNLAGGTITGALYVGGIVGYMTGATVSGATNAANVTGSGNNTGGIAGYVTGSTIDGCTNNGAVKSTASYLGGIVGQAVTGSSIKSSTNNGTVGYTGTSASAGYHAGGIAGSIGTGDTDATSVTICLNTGTISSSQKVGGIVGSQMATTTIARCKNTGKITMSNYLASTATDRALGGIAGYSETTGANSILACLNIGNIERNGTNYAYYAGGIIGKYAGSATANSVINRSYSNATKLEANGANGGIVGSTTTSYSVVSNSWAFFTTTSAGVITPSVSVAAGDDTGIYFVYEMNSTDCKDTDVWALNHTAIENATYSGTTALSALNFALTPYNTEKENGYYFRLAEGMSSGRLVATASMTANADTNAMTVQSFSGSVSATSPFAYGTSTRIYNIVMSYEKIDFYANTIYNGEVQAMSSVFNSKSSNALVSNFVSKGMGIYAIDYYNYYADSDCTVLTDATLHGATEAGKAPKYVNRNESDSVVAYGVKIGIKIGIYMLGYANVTFTINPIPLELVEDPNALKAYTYNGRLQAVGAAIIGVDNANDLYNALNFIPDGKSITLKASIKNTFDSEYALGMVEAGADMVDYTSEIFATKGELDLDLGWRNTVGSNGYGLTMPLQIKDVGTYVIVPKGSIAGGGIRNFAVTQDNGLSGNNTEYLVTLMKKSITLSDFVQHVYAANSSVRTYDSASDVMFGKYYDNNLHSAPEWFNLAVANMDNTHLYDNDFYTGSDNYKNFFKFTYEWNEILPTATWKNYLPAKYYDGEGGDDYTYALWLQITISINNILYAPNVGTEFQTLARDNFNFGYNGANEYYFMRLTITPHGDHIVEYSTDGVDFVTSSTSYMSINASGMQTFTSFSNATVTFWQHSDVYLKTEIKDVAFGFNIYDTPEEYKENAADFTSEYNDSLRWGNKNNPYWIKNATQLQLLADLVNGTSANTVYTLDVDNAGYYGINWFAKVDNPISDNYTNWRTTGCAATNITFSGGIFRLANSIGIGTAFVFAGTEQAPIGTSYSNYFSGTFDGNSFEIRVNLTRNTNYGGLFGYVNYATIKNLTVSGSLTATSGFNYFGAVAGYAYYSNFDNCVVTAKINTTGSYVGGLVGYLNGGSVGATVTNCRNFNTTDTYAVRGQDYIGGLIGYASGFITISGEVTNHGNVLAERVMSYAGGIIGSTYSNNATTSTIRNAVNTGSVMSGYNSGGIVGRLSGNWRVLYCYNKGNITVGYNTHTTDIGVGGIVGYNASSVASSGDFASIVNCFHEYDGTVGILSFVGFSAEPTTTTGNFQARGGIVGNRASGSGSPQVFSCWTVYYSTDATRTGLNYNTGSYDDNGYVYGKFILILPEITGSYVYKMTYEEWKRVVGNVSSQIIDDPDDKENYIEGARSATSQYSWSGSIGLGNIYFKMSAPDNNYIRVSVYNGSNFINSTVFMTDVTVAEGWNGNTNSLVAMYVQSKASAENLVVGFGEIVAKDPMFIGAAQYTEEDILRTLTAPVFSESSAYFNIQEGTRRTYVSSIAQIDGPDAGTTVWDTGDTVKFTIYVYYYFQQAAGHMESYDGWVYDIDNGTHTFNITTGQYEPGGSNPVYYFVEDIGTQEGVWVGKASFTKTIQELVVEFSYTNFDIIANPGANVSVNGDGFSKYYDNYNGFYGAISQPELGDNDRYPYGVNTDLMKSYYDAIPIDIAILGTSYYPHYAKSSNPWVTTYSYSTAIHNNSTYGSTKDVSTAGLYVWFCVRVSKAAFDGQTNIKFANPYATSSGITCSDSNYYYIWVCTPTAVGNILQRPIVVTPSNMSKNYDGIGYTETYSTNYGRTPIGKTYDGNSSVYYTSSNLRYEVSYPRYARFDGATGADGVTYENTDSHLLISSVSGSLKGTFGISEVDKSEIVIASGTSRTDFDDIASPTEVNYSYMTSTGSETEGLHKDGREIYIPGRYRYTINNFATANSDAYDVIFNNGYDEKTGKWIVGSASGSYNSSSGLYDGTRTATYFEIYGSRSANYGSSISGTTTISYSSSYRAVFATASSSNITGSGSKSSNLVINNSTFTGAFHSDKITTLPASNNLETNYGYGRGFSFAHNPESSGEFGYKVDMTYGLWGSKGSGYGFKTDTDTQTYWLDVYFSGDILKEALKGTLVAGVNMTSLSGFDDDHQYIGIGIIGHSTYPAYAEGTTNIQNCVGDSTAMNGMDSYRYANGNLKFSDNEGYACSTFIPAGAKGIRIIVRVVANGGMAQILTSLNIGFKTQFTQASYNTGITFGSSSNDSKTFTAVNSTNGSGNNIGRGQFNYSSPSAVKWVNSGNGLEFDKNDGNRATMGINATLESSVLTSNNWTAGYTMRLSLYAEIGTAGSNDKITIGLKAGHTSNADGNMSLDNAIYWNGYYRSAGTTDGSGDNNYVRNIVLTKQMFQAGGLLYDTKEKFTILFDATANGNMSFSVKKITIKWEWVRPIAVQAPDPTTSSNTLAKFGGWNLSGNKVGSGGNAGGLHDINNSGRVFYVGEQHTTQYSLKNMENRFLGFIGDKKPGFGFDTGNKSAGLLAMAFDMTTVNNKLVSKGKTLSDFNMRITYYGEDAEIGMLSKPDDVRVVAYPGLRYGVNSNMNEADNFGVDETVYTRLGYEAASDRERHDVVISLAVVAEHSYLFTLFAFFDSYANNSNLDWYLSNMEFVLEPGGVQKQERVFTAQANDTAAGSIVTGYMPNGGGSVHTLGYNSIRAANQYTSVGKMGNPDNYFWGSGTSAIDYNSANGLGYAYTGGSSEAENSGYAQMGTSVFVHAGSTDKDGKSLIHYANEGRLRISYEAIVHSPGTADTISVGIYKKGMQKSSDFSPMLNSSLIADGLSETRLVTDSNEKFYSYYFYPYVALDSNGNPKASSNNTLTQGTDSLSAYWGFSVFFQDITDNALEMRVKFLNIKIEVLKDMEYDTISYKDDYIENDVDQAKRDTYVFDTRANYYSANSKTPSNEPPVGTSTYSYHRSATKAWGFYNLQDENWWIASTAKNAELTHNVLTYSNYGGGYTNSTTRDTKVGFGHESGLGDIITDTIAGSIGSIYTAPSKSTTIGFNVNLTDRIWRMFEDTQVQGIKVSFNWSGLPNYNNRSDTTGAYIKTGMNNFYAGWSNVLFSKSVVGSYADGSGVTGTPYSRNLPLTLNSGYERSGGGTVYVSSNRIRQAYGTYSSGNDYINTTNLSFNIAKGDIINNLSTSRAFSVFFSSEAYNSQASMSVWGVSLELIPYLGDTVDTTYAVQTVAIDSYAPASPIGLTPIALDSDIRNADGENNSGAYPNSFSNGKNNFYYNNMFYYSKSSTSVGMYTEYKVDFVDKESVMWGFEIWLGNSFTTLSNAELNSYTGARFIKDGTTYKYDKNGTYRPTYRVPSSISPYLDQWPDQDTAVSGVQWAKQSADVYKASYMVDRTLFDGNSIEIEVDWKPNEAQFEGDYVTDFASMTINIVTDTISEAINVLGFNSMGMTGDVIKLETSRYDGTAPTMSVKTIAKTTVGATTFHDLNANGVYDSGVDILYSENGAESDLQNTFVSNAAVKDMYATSSYNSKWFVPGQNTLIAEFQDEGTVDGASGGVSSGLGLLLPFKMVMTGTGAIADYEWRLDVSEGNVFYGTWQWYSSTSGKWINIEAMSGLNATAWYETTLNTNPDSSIVTINPSEYNIDYYDYTGDRTYLTESEIAAQRYMDDIYKLTKYFVNTVSQEVTHSTVDSVTAVRVRYVRNCSENSTFFFAGYDAAGNMATPSTADNAINNTHLLNLYAYKSFSGSTYNIDTTNSYSIHIGKPITGHVRNIDRIYQEAISVTYNNVATNGTFSSSTNYYPLQTSVSRNIAYAPKTGYMFVGWELKTSGVSSLPGAQNTLDTNRIRKLTNAKGISSTDFGVTYHTYWMGMLPHRQTSTNTNKLMPVQKPSSVSVTVSCYMAPIVLTQKNGTAAETEIGVSTTSGEKVYDGAETVIKLKQIGKISTGNPDYDGITNPGMAPVGVVDENLFSTNIVSGTGSPTISNSTTNGFFASMKDVYIYAGNVSERKITFSIKRAEDGVEVGKRVYSFKITPRPITMSFSGTAPSVYDGKFQGYNLNISNIIGSHQIKLRVVSVSGDVYRNESSANRVTASSTALYKNSSLEVNTFKSVNAGSYAITLALATDAVNNNYMLTSNVSTSYTITKATMTGLNFNDGAVVYNGKSYYLRVYTTPDNTSLTKTSPHTGYSYQLQHTNALNSTRDTVNGQNGTSVAYSGSNAGHSDSGVFTGLGATVTHPNYNNWTVSGKKLTIVKAKLNIAVIAGKTIIKEYDMTTAVPDDAQITQGTYFSVTFVTSLASYAGTAGLVIDGTTTVPNPSVSLSNMSYNNATVGTGKTIGATASLISSYTTNYQLTSSSLTFAGQITKKTISVSWSGAASYVYTAARLGPSFYINNSLGENLTYAIEVTQGNNVYFHSDSAPINTSVSKTLPPSTSYYVRAVDYGSYTVKIKLNSTTNYTMTDSTRSWQITKETVTLSWLLDGVTAQSGASVVYTGTAHNVTHSLTGSLDTAEQLYITLDGDITATDFKTAGGGYTVTATLGGTKAGNYTLNGVTTFTWQITKAALSLTWKFDDVTATSGKTIVYDGNAHTVSYSLTGAVPADNTTEKLSVTLGGDITATNVKTADGGIYTVTATLGGTKAGNYTFSGETTFTWQITKAALSLTWKFDGVTATSGKTIVYDGSAHTVSYSLTGAVPADNTSDKLSVTLTGDTSATNVKTTDGGIYTVTATLGGTRVGNYTFSGETSFTWQITKAALTLSWKFDGSAVDATVTKYVVFDGLEHSASATLAGSFDSASLVYITLSGSISATNVKLTDSGVYTVTATLGGTKSSNYTMSGVTTFKWQITAKAVAVINWSGVSNDYTYTYNGQEYGTVMPLTATAPYITATFTDLVGTSRQLSISFRGKSGMANGLTVFKNAGAYDISAIAPTSPDGWLPQNYSFAGATKASVTMLQRSVDGFSWSGTSSVVYTGSPIVITSVANPKKAVANGVASGDIVSISYSGNSGTNAGSYTISVTSITNGNYIFNPSASGLTSVWTISKAVITMKNVSISKVYDGTKAYSGAFVRGVHYDTECATASVVAVNYSSITFVSKDAGTTGVYVNGLATSNTNYQVSGTNLYFAGAGVITQKTLEIKFDTPVVSMSYNGGNIYGIYNNIADANTSTDKFYISIGSASGNIPTAAYKVDDFTVTAKFVEVSTTPDGIPAGAYNGYVNQREKLYYKNMVFTMTSVDGSAANYMIKVKDCTASANASTITVEDKDMSTAANNTIYSFRITPLNLRGEYTNTNQSYRATGGVPNTVWNDVGFVSKTTLFTEEWNAGKIFPRITQAWQQGEDPEVNPGIYSKYSIIMGNKINDEVKGPYGTEDLLNFKLEGGAADGGKSVYNYSYTFAQPRLVIGYFISDTETGARVDSLAALMLVDFYYASGDYSVFTQTTDINGVLTNKDYETLMNSDHPGMAEYLSEFEIGSTIEFIPIGQDFDGRFIREFNGIYNGSGYTINNIIITSATSTDADIGLFSVIGIDGEVKNVHIRNAVYTRYSDNDGINSRVGGIAGINKGFIHNCSFNGDLIVGIDPIYGNVASVGGITGENYGILENIVAAGSASVKSSTNYVGGIAGTHAYSYTERQYVYVGGVCPENPTTTRTLSANKITNALSFMEINSTTATQVNNIAGGIVGRAITATGRGDIDGDTQTYIYSPVNFSGTESAIYATTDPTVPDIVYLSNATLKRTSSGLMMYGDWSRINRRTGNSTDAGFAGKDYNYMRKIGDESETAVLNTVATAGFESYLRYVAKGKNDKGEPQILDKLYFVLVDIIDVYVIQANQVGNGIERYRYAKTSQKVYTAYFYDADAEGGAAVYEYNLDTSKSLPIVHRYDASVYNSLYYRQNVSGTITYITLGELLGAADLTGKNYVTVGGVKYLHSNVGLFTKYTTPTGAIYTATSGEMVSSAIEIRDNTQISLIADYRFATFVVTVDLKTTQFFEPYEGGFYGYLNGTTKTNKKTITVDGSESLFEMALGTAFYDSTTLTLKSINS